MPLIALFKKECGYALEGLHRHYAIVLYLLGTFLFVGGSNGRGSTMLLVVEDGLHHMNTHMSLVLTETIICLDSLRYYLDHTFGKLLVALGNECWSNGPFFF